MAGRNTAYLTFPLTPRAVALRPPDRHLGQYRGGCGMVWQKMGSRLQVLHFGLVCSASFSTPEEKSQPFGNLAYLNMHVPCRSEVMDSGITIAHPF